MALSTSKNPAEKLIHEIEIMAFSKMSNYCFPISHGKSMLKRAIIKSLKLVLFKQMLCHDGSSLYKATLLPPTAQTLLTGRLMSTSAKPFTEPLQLFSSSTLSSLF